MESIGYPRCSTITTNWGVFERTLGIIEGYQGLIDFEGLISNNCIIFNQLGNIILNNS